jgi:DNA-binding response OmpR family regulator
MRGTREGNRLMMDGKTGRRRILVVEPAIEFMNLLAYNLKLAGYQVATLRDGDAAKKTLRRRPCDLVVVGPSFSEARAAEIFKSLRGAARVPGILLSFTRSGQSSAGKDGATREFALLPFSVNALLECTNGMLRNGT